MKEVDEVEDEEEGQRSRMKTTWRRRTRWKTRRKDEGGG